ncbi:uncharacterized protein [Phyllobates terribilis]|uniref:uncharacterized protein n=1 Tax=Phyllobates terribilis TaxID=111132 RepID=UPI003CCB6FAA
MEGSQRDILDRRSSALSCTVGDGPPCKDAASRELYRIMEFVRNMERRRLIKPQDILATLQSIPEDESESELQEHVFDSDSDEDFIPQNISSESEDSEGTNPEDIPSTSTGDRAHAVMLPRDHPPGRGQKKSAKRPRNERTTDNDGGEGNATTNTREGESEGILVSADDITKRIRRNLLMYDEMRSGLSVHKLSLFQYIRRRHFASSMFHTFRFPVHSPLSVCVELVPDLYAIFQRPDDDLLIEPHTFSNGTTTWERLRVMWRLVWSRAAITASCITKKISTKFYISGIRLQNIYINWTPPFLHYVGDVP